jgi:hypothetical protein
MSLLDTASLVVTPNGTKASKLYSVVPSSGAGDLSVTRATTATRVNSSGLIESVASNVPRLDYTNGSCPSILVEPQRTNLQRASEDLSNTSFWSYGATTATANQITSPSGILNADKIAETATTARHELYSDAINFTGSNAISFFIKAAGRQYISVLSGGDPSLGGITIDAVNGTITNTSGGTNASIEDFGSGWFKVSFTTTRTGLNQLYWCFRTASASPNIETYAGDGTSGFYIWGAQVEEGSYATSYIPTTSASVTRNADVISKTGISSLIGQTEGTIFVDIDLPNNSSNDIFTFSNTGVNDIFLASNGGNIQARIYSNSTPLFFAQFPITSGGGRFKIAISYKSGNSSFYVNGILLSNNSGAIGFTTTLDTINLTNNQYAGLNNKKFNLVGLWKTALTNTQLAQLTTI